MLKCLGFPFEKIEKGSKVVLYGGGVVGTSMYKQNAGWSNIIAVIDKDENKVFEGIKCSSIEVLKKMDFDYILISVSDIYFSEVYQKLVEFLPVELHDKIISISCQKKEKLEENDCLTDDFHYRIEDTKYRAEKINKYNKLYLYKKERCVASDISFTKLLLLGYQYTRATFHVVDDSKMYLGTLDENIWSDICELNLDGLTAGEVIERVKILNLNVFHASESSELLNSLYSKFVLYNYNEIPIIENGVFQGVIERIAFNAEFFSMEVSNDELYIKKRKYDFKNTFKKWMLNKYAYNVNSQTGEDGVLRHIFNVIGLKSRYAVEFGGWDGIHLSNIREIILKNDMRALFIEGDSKRAEEGKKNYENNPNVTFVNEYIGINKYKNLEQILEEQDAPVNIDLLSIDIDGWDYWVWESLVSYKPRVVVIEYNQSIGKDLVVINPKNESTRTGSSALAFVELGKRKGYELACLIGCNLIFVIEEEYQKLGIVDNSLEALWCLSGFCNMFSTYSGDVYGDPWSRNGIGVFKPIN